MRAIPSAICHQTTPRGAPQLEGTVDGQHRRGWDYLFGRFEQAARDDAAVLSPEYWAQIGESEVRRLFHDSELGDLLTDPEGRAALLRDLGKRMLAHNWRNADDIYELCEHRIAAGQPSLLGTLAQFEAYGDPVKKKSHFFSR